MSTTPKELHFCKESQPKLHNIKLVKARRSTTTARLHSFSESATTSIKSLALKAQRFKRNGKRRLKFQSRRMSQHQPNQLQPEINHQLQMDNQQQNQLQLNNKKHQSKNLRSRRRTKRLKQVLTLTHLLMPSHLISRLSLPTKRLNGSSKTPKFLISRLSEMN